MSQLGWNTTPRRGVRDQMWPIVPLASRVRFPSTALALVERFLARLRLLLERAGGDHVRALVCR